MGVKIYSLSFLKVLRYTAIRRSENEKNKNEGKEVCDEEKERREYTPKKKESI